MSELPDLAVLEALLLRRRERLLAAAQAGLEQAATVVEQRLRDEPDLAVERRATADGLELGLAGPNLLARERGSLHAPPRPGLRAAMVAALPDMEAAVRQALAEE